MFFPIFKPLFLFALRQFFDRIAVIGEPVQSGPLLIVANHPDFALDAMVISSAYRRPLWYLAKATLFQNRLQATLLRSMHLIPLFRRQDDATQVKNNLESFRVVLENLKRGRAILIFPEGVSLGERLLQPMKTGAARMALEALEEGIPIKMQAVGLTYTDLTRFRSGVTIAIGRPFDIQKLADTDHAGVRVLTERIEQELRGVTVDVKVKEHEWLVENIARLYRSREEGDERSRFDIIARNVEQLAPHMHEKRAQVERNIRDYLTLCDLFGFDGGEQFSKKHSPWLLGVGALAVMVGVVIYRIPYWLVGVRAGRVTHAVELHSTKFLFGIIVFSAWILGLALLAFLMTGKFLTALIAFTMLFMLGVVTNRFVGPLRVLVLKRFWPGEVSPVVHLARMRDGIIAELEALRVL